MHGAEAQDDMATGGRPAKAQHRTEARKQEYLVQLMTKINAVGPGENPVADHLAIGVNGDIYEQAVRQGELEVVFFRGPGLRIFRKSDELGRTQNIQRHIVGIGLHNDARHDQLQNDREDKNGGEKSSGRRNSERAENVVEKNFGARDNKTASLR